MESQEHYNGRLVPRRAVREARAVDPAPRFYSVAEVAHILGTSTMTVYRAIAAGEFPAIKIRGRLIVPACAIEAMADAAVADQTVVDAAGWVPEGVAR
jgi:excisionase family DNA binding protein